MITVPAPRSGRTLGLAAVLLLLTASPALAHTGIGPVHGMAHGLVHPLGGWDHLLAMVAVGLWAAQRSGRAVWSIPAGFLLGMVGGGALGMTGVALPAVEAGILLSVMILGALVAAAVRPPLAASLLLVALFGMLHGHAHGAEMPAAVSALSYAIGFCGATALLHASGALAALGLRRYSARAASMRMVRLAGSAIAAAGVCLAVIR
ncbi:MAG: HupE/UreJ family protein [Gemmatimonadaceae bacterium]